MTQVTKQAYTPGGVSNIGMNMPEEGEIFTEPGGGVIYKMVGGKLQVF
jgi:hypothetical protein